MYTACPDVLHKNQASLYMIFFLYSRKVQYLRFVSFHVKHEKHVLYKKILYNRQKINNDYILYVRVKTIAKIRSKNNKIVRGYFLPLYGFFAILFLWLYFKNIIFEIIARYIYRYTFRYLSKIPLIFIFYIFEFKLVPCIRMN